METDIRIRMARREDAPALLDIFTPYVLQTAVAFNYEPPTLEEFRATMEDRLRRYPYLVAQRGGELIGYAYASPFKARAAYDWCCETTIYLRRGATRCGMGRALYEALEKALGQMGILNLYAVVACPEEQEDEGDLEGEDTGEEGKPEEEQEETPHEEEPGGEDPGEIPIPQ